MHTTVDEVGDGSWRVTVAGELDAATAPDLVAALRPLVAHPSGSVVVNMSEVSFMDSSGLRALIHAANDAKAAGGSVVLVAVSAAVNRLLEVTGLVDHLGPGLRG